MGDRAGESLETENANGGGATMFMTAGVRAGAYVVPQLRSPMPFLSRAQLLRPSSPPPPSASSCLTPSSSGFSADQGPPRVDNLEGPNDSVKRKEQHVDKALMRFLVGKGGSIKAKLEKENGVMLSIPSSFESTTSVFINGSESSIKAASIAIQKLVDDAVQSKLQYTHFISLPLASHPALVEQVENFQKSVLGSLQSSVHSTETSSDSEGESDSTGIHKSIFVKPARIHLTVLMLKLWNEERLQAASDVLQKSMPFVHKALGDQPIVVDLEGLECMRGTPDKAHVLYAEVKDSKHKGRLLQCCQVLIDAFVESGLVLERDVGQSLKLHATLMNTTQRKKKKDWSSRRVPFDARGIVEKYGNWNWGEYTILEAHLSERFVYDDNGYYHCVCAIPFPGHALDIQNR